MDWHGVLSDKLFWHSILANRRHRLHSHLKNSSELLFKAKKDLARQWMRGEVSSQEVLEQMDFNATGRYDREYLRRQLYRDCRNMDFNRELMNFLREVYSHSFFVLATDNMECFYSSLSHIDELLDSFNFVLCSSELGILKSDGVREFFGPWLAAHNLTFKESILIDDSEDTCGAFRKAGGTSFLYTGLAELKRDLLGA